MKLMKNKYTNIILAVTCILLLILIFMWIDYLVKNNYIYTYYEHFTNTNINTNNVNIPLTTTQSCSNFCGPNARCAITGHQCISDIDCPGCKPNMPNKQKQISGCISGNNDAGKLTLGVTPQYSTLTTDIGTQAAFFNHNMFQPSPQANFGINTWHSPFNKTNKLFRSRYTPHNLQYMPIYPKGYSITGVFVNEDPIASNDYIHES